MEHDKNEFAVRFAFLMQAFHTRRLLALLGGLLAIDNQYRPSGNALDSLTKQ